MLNNSFVQEPEHVDNILNLIQSISDEARRLLADPELPRETQLDALGVSLFCYQMFPLRA